MDLPTSSESMTAEWAGLSPEKREITTAMFSGLRDALPEARRADRLRLLELSVLAAKASGDRLAPEGKRTLARICGSGSDPEGLAFIDHMDAIANEAVEQYRLPPGERWDVESNPLHRAVAGKAYRQAANGGAQ